jgi:peptide/nickel transport system substrate-binding protein
MLDNSANRADSVVGLNRRDLLRRAAGLAVGSALTLQGKSAWAGTLTDLAKPAKKHGGILRVGISGGNPKGALNPYNSNASEDIPRLMNVYEQLYQRDTNYLLQPRLAEEITSNPQGTVWTIRLRDGVEFHNGKTLDADDVIFSFRKMLAPVSSVRSGVSFIDLKRLKRLDRRTVRMVLPKPYGLVVSALGTGYQSLIVPVGFDPRHPIGTGPFKVKKFQPGQVTQLERFPNYGGSSYLDGVDIFEFSNDTARINALLSGQIHATNNVPASQISQVKNTQGLTTITYPTGKWLTFTMRMDQPPFNDVRVRQAMRLIVDRNQMVKQGLGGFGRVGNDIYSPFDPCYDKTLPQRKQDIAQAKALLAAAGQQNLVVDLNTASIASGVLEASLVFAQQAKEAGVRINIKQMQPGDFYGSQFLKYNFAVDYWSARNMLETAALTNYSKASYNECHFNDPVYDRIYQRAVAEPNSKKRCPLIKQLQKIEYDQGGFIIWAFANGADAFSKKVTGFVPDKTGFGMDSYDFRKVSFV